MTNRTEMTFPGLPSGKAKACDSGFPRSEAPIWDFKFNAGDRKKAEPHTRLFGGATDSQLPDLQG